ncbi:MAG: YbhB/YbcL family Raf kinase inhibitor-like protein [Promethearchaeota archaeon]
MWVKSEDIRNNEMIDKKFTCQGEDFSPHLKWGDVPENTKSFAITCLSEHHQYGIIGHWYVYNIPPDIREVPQNGPIPGIEIENDFNMIGYEGPCPDDGEVHEYIFTIYALDKQISEQIDNINFRKIIREYTIDFAQIKVFYKREFDFKIFQHLKCR